VSALRINNNIFEKNYKPIKKKLQAPTKPNLPTSVFFYLPSTSDKLFLSSLDAMPFPNQHTQKYQIHFPEQHFGTKPTLKNNQII